MILVTGATGTTGKALVRELSARGIATRALVRNLEKAKDIALPNVEVVLGDLLDPDSLSAILNGVEAVYLLSSGDPQSVTAQKNLIDAAKIAKVKRIVKHSGLGSSHQSPIKLEQWHAEIEDYLAASGLEFTVLRPHFFFQNLLWDAAMVKNQGVLYAPMADAKFSAIDARDIAGAAITVLTQPGHNGKVYELTGPEAVSYQQIADELSNITAKPVQYVALDFDSFYKAGMGAGMPEWMAADVTNLYRHFVSGAASEISPALKLLTGKQGNNVRNFLNDYSAAFV